MSDQDLRTLQIIYIAQAVGATFFTAVAIFFTLQSHPASPGSLGSRVETIHILLMVLAVLGSIEYAVAEFLYKKFLSGFGSFAKLEIPARIRSAMIVRIAFYQGICFFGLVIFLLAGMNGILTSHPLYSLAILPYFILLTLIMNTFPNKERIETLMSQLSA